ncbi:hypothetical protein NDU88_001118 [Pleurodeles waltl]|uniref:Uncharacterized protein n=1 Tax=Pleurodeles waltl TaxID=8319 RepID=A0AAV7LBN7_PLEWA|nr:hypothetical protein NDU88_001118 [Pleurodeles waltl]
MDAATAAPPPQHSIPGSGVWAPGSRRCSGVHCSASTLTQVRRVESPGEVSQNAGRRFRFQVFVSLWDQGSSL